MDAQSLLVRPRRTSWSQLRWGNLALCYTLEAFEWYSCVAEWCFVWVCNESRHTHFALFVCLDLSGHLLLASMYVQHCECCTKALNLNWCPLSSHWLLHVDAESPQWHTGGEALAWLAALTSSFCLCERPRQVLAGIESRCILHSVGHHNVLNDACNNITAVMLWLALLLVIMAWVVQFSQLPLMMTSLAGHVLWPPAIAIWTMLHIQSFSWQRQRVWYLLCLSVPSGQLAASLNGQFH